MLSDKAKYEDLESSHIQRLHIIVGKFLNNARAIDPTMLMAINSMVVLQKNPTTGTAKEITQF